MMTVGDSGVTLFVWAILTEIDYTDDLSINILTS